MNSQTALNKQVSFLRKQDLPTDLSGMQYLKANNDSVVPLRDSPRRPETGHVSVKRSQSPLRQHSPRRLNQAAMDSRVPVTSGQNYGNFDRIEQQEFSKILKDNIFLERELESARIETSLKPDFNLLDAFKIVDTKGIGNVTVQDITQSLKEVLNFNEFSHDDVYLLFRRFDKNQDGKLSF
jgi:hypothetical protein